MLHLHTNGIIAIVVVTGVVHGVAVAVSVVVVVVAAAMVHTYIIRM